MSKRKNTQDIGNFFKPVIKTSKNDSNVLNEVIQETEKNEVIDHTLEVKNGIEVMLDIEPNKENKGEEIVEPSENLDIKSMLLKE